MRDSDFLELANRVIDDAASDEERTAFETALKESIHRRLEFEQLSTVVGILDAVRPVEPPEGLRNRILAAIPATKPAKTRPSLSGLWQGMIDAVGARPKLGVAYAVVAGLVVGIIGFGAIWGTVPNDTANVFGTMSSYRGADEFRTIDRARLDQDGLRADVVLKVSEEAFRVELDFSSEDATDVEVAVIPPEKRWSGIVRAEGSAAFDASIGEGTLKLRQLQSGNYAFIGQRRADAGGEVRVSFEANNGASRAVSLAFSAIEQ